MKLLRYFSCLAFFIILAGLFSPLVMAQGRTFAVTPFEIKGPEKFAYLSHSTQAMFLSRMSAGSRFQGMDREEINNKAPAAPKGVGGAREVKTLLGVDYLVWGSVDIEGDAVKMDVSMMDPSGNVTHKSSSSRVNGMIPALENMARDLAMQSSGKPDAPSSARTTQQVVQHNPDFVVNQTTENQQVFLNPQFRYEGSSDTPGRWRSQAFPYASVGLAIGDIDGDGENETVVISTRHVYVYRFRDQQLVQLAEYKSPPKQTNLNVNVFDYNGDGKGEIIVSSVYDTEPRSFVLGFDGNKLTLLQENIRMFLNVAAVPPDFSKVVVGCRGDSQNLFQRGVFEVVTSGGKFTSGAPLTLPKKANAFNFSYLPEENSYKVVMIDTRDRLEIYSPKGDLLSKTEEEYAGSTLGLKFDELRAPMDNTVNKPDYLWSYYYVPLPILLANLDNSRRYDVIVSRNISVAAQFFENYRLFSQGELHDMFWDGVGMSLKWKTRRIKGTITGYALADINNNGQKDLVVALNTHPGPAGVSSRKCIITAYTLDTSTTGTVRDY